MSTFPFQNSLRDYDKCYISSVHLLVYILFLSFNRDGTQQANKT
jgi:hypothetical protein